tara:strand:+ start:1041 stop:1220 length:180 start_codon:yes stop_codon:yes gene_type:complete
MSELNYLIEENEYLKKKLSLLHQQNALLESKQRDAMKAVKDCLDLIKKEMKAYEAVAQD